MRGVNGRARSAAWIATAVMLGGCIFFPPIVGPHAAPATAEELAAAFEAAGIPASLDGDPRDILTANHGIGCQSSSDTMMHVDPAAYDDLIGAAGVTAGWLDERMWVGDPVTLAEELGAIEVALGRGLWMILGDPAPHAVEAMHVATPDGFDVWLLVDEIRSCNDSTWPVEQPAGTAAP